MTGFVARRVVSALPTLVGISLVAFLILEVLPRAPLLAGPGDGTLSAGTAALLERAADDRRPAAVRYAAWGAGLLQGDLGRSRRTGRPVTAILGDALPWTLFLNFCAVAVIYGLAIPYGGLAAARRGSLTDRLGGGLLLVLYAVPPFAAALLLQQGLAVRWPLLPLHGVPSAGTGEAAGALPLLR
ncbi:MAG: ABC transporter permease, partial [Candidatus Polarisedimenticolia bacterium]